MFGCFSYASTIKNNKHKFYSRARKCAFSGYKVGMKGFVLLDTDNHEIIISINMKFLDMEFPYLDKSIPHVPTNTYLDYHHSTIGDIETEPTNSYVHNPTIESEHVPQIIENEPIQVTDTSKTRPDDINKFKSIAQNNDQHTSTPIPRPEQIKKTRQEPLNHLFI